MKHFQHVNRPFGDTPNHPVISRNRIGGLWASDIAEFIYIAYESENESPIMSHFFCSQCKRWYAFWSSIGNVKCHLQCMHSVEEKHLEPSDILHCLYCFILTNGLPFRLIEDQYLSRLLHTQVSRQQLAKHCDAVAEIVDQKISLQLQAFKYSIGVFDEWTDNAARPYVGVTLHGITESPDESLDHHVMVIAHIPLYDLHITHQTLSAAIKKRFDQLEIAVPDTFITDGGSKCEPAVNDLFAEKRECWGHVLNLLLKDIHNELRCRLPLVFEVQASHGKSSVFYNYMSEHEAPRGTIPGYVETRFYSMGKLFNTVHVMFDLINQYGEDTGHGELLPDSYRHYIECANSLLTTFKSVIKKLESDRFGSISFVLPGLKMLQHAAEQVRFSYPELFAAFDGSFIKHVDPILNHFDKKKDLIVASLLNPSIHHPSFFTADEMILGFEAIRLELPKPPEAEIISQPIDWSNFSPSRNGDPIEVYKKISENWVDDDADLRDFWLINVKSQLKSMVPVAIKYLLPPSTNTSSERLFSKARNVLSLNRLSLSHERSSNAVICAANPDLTDAAITDILEDQ